MAETSLKPCPFCGKAMQYRAALFVSDGCTDAVIHAEPTDCGLVQFDIGATDGGVSTIAAWNRRATDPAVAELVAALAKALAEIESEPQCCGRGQPVVRNNELVGEECCGSPEYGFDRAAAVIRAALAKHAAKP